MTDKKKNGWIKFVPSLDLPKERVSIAYDTHDERGVRYTYGHFQFYNGSCGCFWKDGNEQPKVVKAEDIKYWMPVPSLDAQEEPVSEDLEKAATLYAKEEYNRKSPTTLPDRCKGCYAPLMYAFKAGAQWQKQKDKKWLAKNHKQIFDNGYEEGFEIGRDDMEEQMMANAIDVEVKVDAGGYPCIPQMELYDYEKDIPLAKEGDKYKVILIKED